MSERELLEKFIEWACTPTYGEKRYRGEEREQELKQLIKLVREGRAQ